MNAGRRKKTNKRRAHHYHLEGNRTVATVHLLAPRQKMGTILRVGRTGYLRIEQQFHHQLRSSLRGLLYVALLLRDAHGLKKKT